MSEGLHVPSVWEESGNDNEDDVGLNPREVREFRGLAWRTVPNYWPYDWPDIRFATKEVCRCVSKPARRCLGNLERIARNLLARRELHEMWKLGRHQGLH